MDEIGPDLIGRYQIQRRIGAGGMGVLWLAHDPMLDRLVAIKLMRDGGESAEAQERFLREARSAGRLHHPNIVTIFDVGQHQGALFIAMQYIVGETLANVVHRRAPLPVARKLRWMEDLCNGLHFAHRAGIIHRDIKPANVMVDASDEIKILDFGIARLDTGSVTQGGLVGTLNYISPEQMEGRPVDRRADIFALGAVLYELFAYQRAFPGGITDGVLAKILYGEPEPLDRIVPDIDLEIVAIVSRCLAKSEADRYPDCLALAQALATIRLRHDQGRAPSLGADETVIAPMPVGVLEASDLVRIRADEVRTHLALARAAMADGAFEEAVRECERAVVLDPDDSEALRVAEKARAALEHQQIEHWIVEGRAELSRHGLTAASLNADRALALDPVSADAIRLRAAVDAAERESGTTQVQSGPPPPVGSTGIASAVQADLARGLETPRRSTWARWAAAISLFGVAVTVAGASWLTGGLWGGSLTNQPPPLQSSVEPPQPAKPQGVAATAVPETRSSIPPTAAPTARTQSPPPVGRPAVQTSADLRSSDIGRGRGPESPAPSPTVSAQADKPIVPTPTTTPALRLGAPVSTASGVLSGTGVTLPQPPPVPVAANTPSEAEKAAARRADDEAAINGVLAEYKSAHERRDAAAVRRVGRSLTTGQERQLAQIFDDLRSVSIQVEYVRIPLQTDSTATVLTLQTRTTVGRTGQTFRDVIEMKVEFQKIDNKWIITKLSETRSR